MVTMQSQDLPLYVGWKAIAKRLGVSRTTAWRYWKEEGLPVEHYSKGVVYMIEKSCKRWCSMKQRKWLVEAIRRA
jgi:predicted site-specific integrase-resolvase